jgi:Uma2 family endonuclease
MPALLTAEEYARLPDTGTPSELQRGHVVAMNPPYPFHGYVCGNVAFLVRSHTEPRDMGRVFINDSGVVTERGPDTVRGADVAFYSYARLPKGTLPRQGYLDVVPDLVFEIRSPDDRLPKLLAKVAEYLAAGVRAVCVADPIKEQVQVYEDADGAAPRILNGDDELTLPAILGDFRVPLRRFWE